MCVRAVPRQGRSRRVLDTGRRRPGVRRWSYCEQRAPRFTTSHRAKQSNSEISPRLSGKTRLFLAGNFLSMLGTGLVLPWMIIYLHEVRGIPLPAVGAMLAAAAATGLVAGGGFWGGFWLGGGAGGVWAVFSCLRCVSAPVP